jgi:hypothetical protein
MQLIDRSAVRLTFGDDLFLRRHRGLGSPIVNQFAWRFDRPVPSALLVGLRDELARGALARRADRALVPGARGRWSHTAHTPRLTSHPDLLDDHEVVPWLRANGAVRLDPTTGDSWRLSSARLTSGGMVLSLLVDHAVADGGAMVDAVERAAAGRDPLTLPGPPNLVRAIAADVHDAATRVTAVALWGAASARRTRTRSGGPPPAPTQAVERRPGPGLPEGWVVPLVVVECSTSDIESAAARHGGTPNAWFVTVCASLAVTAGVAPPGGPVRVALPVSARSSDDTRSNATRIARVDVEVDDLSSRDLTRTRARCKEAYARLSSGPGDGDTSVLTLVQMLPDAVVRRLPPPPSATVLASNLGAVSTAFRAPVGRPARSIAALAGHRHVDETEIRALGGGLTAWACTSGDRTTVSVAALDPDRVPDDETLRELVTSVLASWDVEARLW